MTWYNINKKILLIIGIYINPQIVLFAQVECDKLLQIINKNEIIKNHDINSELIITNDTIKYSLDPILNYKSLPFDITTTKFRQIYDATAYIASFDYLISTLDSVKRNFFIKYLRGAEKNLCIELEKNQPETLKQSTKEIFNQAVIEYAKSKNLALLNKDSTRGAPLIKIKFVSNPTGAKVKYLTNVFRIIYEENIPEDLWLDADDGDIKELSQSTIYVFRFRWNNKEAWQVTTKKIDKIEELTVIKVNKAK